MTKRASVFIMFVTVLLLQLPAVRAQYVLRQAQAFAAVNNYVKAAPLYEMAYEKRKAIEAARSLAGIYAQTKEYVFAESWYAKVMAMPEHTADDALHYAEVLMNNAKYSEASTQLQAYLLQNGSDAYAANMLQGCAMAKEWMSDPVKGTLQNMQALNSRYSDWGIALSGKKYVFASDRPSGQQLAKQPFFSNGNGVDRSVYTMTGNSYLHLFEGDGRDSASIHPLDKKVNGDYHSASPSYNANGKEMYHAAIGSIKTKVSFLGKEKPHTARIDIVENTWDSATASWGAAVNIPLSGLGYSAGDPCISADGRTLFFVSGEPGGFGGTDIYYATKDEYGKWGEPKNLGAAINTKGNERTPFIDATGNLYFASDGRPGMGGLDLFKAVPAKNKGEWDVVNMGAPVNSPQDDFAPYILSENELYFSSNRTGGKGSDDIYHFLITKTPAPVVKALVFTTGGIVRDEKTHEPIADAVITLYNKTSGTPQKTITSSEGKYQLGLDSASNYVLSVEKTGYATIANIPLSTTGFETSKTFPENIFLKKVELNKPVALENIYFDLDKWDIRADAIPDLDKLATLMQDNPTYKVEMSSYTDSRGSAAYNMKLSQKRAEATVKYLVDKGIAAGRLTAKGYGDTKLVNGCSKGVACTEEEHQQNRRTAFTITDK